MKPNLPTAAGTERSAAEGNKLSFTAELWQRWLDYVDAKPRTLTTYARAMHSFFGWLQENSIQRPTRKDVLTYRDELSCGHKAATVQTCIAAVRLFFRWTAQEGIYPNVADHVKSGGRRPMEHKKDYLTSSQTRCILDGIDRSTAAGLRDYAMLALMVTTGLRTVSVAEANIEDIRTVGDSTVLFYLGKGRSEKNEYVKLAPPGEQAIRMHLKERGRCVATEPLFASAANRNAGGRLTTRSISRIVKTAMRTAGYDSERLSAHSLRHTAATLNLLNGGSLEETQQLLGHGDISTTLIYSHALERAANQSENRIASAIF